MVKAYIFSTPLAESDMDSLTNLFNKVFFNDKRFFNAGDISRIRNDFDIIVFYGLSSQIALPLLRQLREQVCLPVFFLSQTKEPDLILGAFKLGISDFFTAPFDVREIHEKIHQALPALALHQSKVELARRFIEINYKFPITLADIAKSLRCTPEHLIRLFHARYKTTPHCYLKKVRLDKVKNYLINTDLSLSDISRSTGFYSVGHLCREFKKETHMTPFKFRQRHSRIM